MSSLEVLLKYVRAGDEKQFTEHHPDPFLVLEEQANQEQPDSFQTVRSNPSGSLLGGAAAEPPNLDRGVIAVRKKSKGKFSNMISVGRTASNDVTIDSASVSKFHAYFIQKDNEVWFVQDANSSNGTYVNGQRIPTENPTALVDGVTVQFSQDTRYRFYSSRGLYHFLCNSLEQGT